MNKNYSDVTWLCAHNAYANRHEGWIYAQQKLSLEEQFDAGIRSFMIDIHTKNNKLVVAHGSISTTRFIRPFRKLESFQHILTRFVKMLQKYPNAIITLHIESYSNNISARTIPSVLQESGAENYLYTDSDNWPNIEEMVRSDKRLVVFSNRQRDKPFIHTSATMETNWDLSNSNRNNLRRDNRTVVRKENDW